MDENPKGLSMVLRRRNETKRCEPPATGIPMSYEAFRKLPEGAGLQLIDGLLVREPSPGESHGMFTITLATWLNLYVIEHNLGRVYHAPLDVFLGADPISVVQPDVFFVAANRLECIRPEGVFGAPDLVVEVLSPSTRHYDLGRKRELYLTNGCRELWLVDLTQPAIEVTSLTRSPTSGTLHTPAQVRTYRIGDAIASAVVPGFHISVGDLFRAG